MPSETPGAGSANPQMNWDAVARHLAGEGTAAERAAVDAWLGGRPAEARVVSALDDALNPSMLGGNLAQGIDVEAALAKVNGRRLAESPKVVRGGAPRLDRALVRPPTAPRWMHYAAAAGVVLLAVGLLWRQRSVAPVESPAVAIAARTISTPIGGLDSLVLPDGSRVILGPGSELTIGSGYGQSDRSVAIRGEALFQVQHDAARPFVVTASNVAIRDIGTAFAVHSDSAGVRVTVTEGSVEVKQVMGGIAPVVLEVGDVATVSPQGEIVSERGAGTSDDIAWTKGKLVFRDTPLADVRDDLRRWYGIELDVRDSALLRRPLTNSFLQSDSIDRVLQVLRLSLGVKIDRVGDTAFVRSAAVIRRPQ